MSTFKKENEKNPNLIQRLNNIENFNINEIFQETHLETNFQFFLILKKFQNKIDYKNIELLKIFLEQNGQIISKSKSQISVQNQNKIAKAIRKARDKKLLPFIIDKKIYIKN